jgi:hypothetical protein
MVMMMMIAVEWYRNPENANNWIAPVDPALVAHPPMTNFLAV